MFIYQRVISLYNWDHSYKGRLVRTGDGGNGLSSVISIWVVCRNPIPSPGLVVSMAAQVSHIHNHQ